MLKLKSSVLKNYHPKHISLVVVFLLCVTLILSFQNCANYFMSEDEQSSSSSSNDLSGSASLASIKSRTIVDISTLIAYYSTQPYVVREQLLDQRDVTMNFVYIYPLSANFSWTVKRGSQTLVNSKNSHTPFFKYQFAEKGAYDIFANTYYKEFSTLFTKASKRLIIGEECDIHRIIEFQLTDGSLTVGQSATFELEDPDDEFDNIIWTTSLNTEEVESEDLTIDNIPNNVNLLSVGVSAEEESQSACLTYRQKTFKINKNLQPHTNTFRPYDQDYEYTTITLENNWMYKYRNPAYGDDSQQFFLDVEHADRCTVKISDDDTETVDCETKQALFPEPKTADLDICQEDIITLTAQRDDNKTSLHKKYYQFCPARANASCLALCYFAPLDQRPFHHTCLFESLYPKECTGICYGNLCKWGRGTGSGTGDPGAGNACHRVVGWEGACTVGDPGPGTAPPTTSGNDPGTGRAPPTTSGNDPGTGRAPPTTSGNDPGTGTDPEPVDAQCGDECGECDEGYMLNAGSTTFVPNETCTWDCATSYGEWARGCTAHATPTDGQCPDPTSSCGECAAGNPTRPRTDENGLCTWECEGEYEGNSPTCSHQEDPINGVCGDDYAGDCESGDGTDVSICYYGNGNEEGKHCWTCEGLYNGEDSEKCFMDIPEEPEPEPEPEPPTTQPPATQPPVTQPPVTQPPTGCATTTTCRDGSAASSESITDSNGNIIGYKHYCHPRQLCGTTGTD